MDGEVKVWNFSTGERLKAIASEGVGDVQKICCAQVGQHKSIVGWTSLKRLVVWEDRREVYEPRPSYLTGHEADVQCMAFERPSYFVAGTSLNSIALWNLDSHALKGTLRPKVREAGISVERVIFYRAKAGQLANGAARTTADGAAADRLYLFAASSDGTVRIWHVKYMTLVFELPVRMRSWDERIEGCDACDAMAVLAVGSSAGFVKVWEINDGALRSGHGALRPGGEFRATERTDLGAAVVFVQLISEAGRGRQVAVGCADYSVTLWTLLGVRLGIFGQRPPFMTPSASFFSKSRSMPTANAEDPCRSEGT